MSALNLVELRGVAWGVAGQRLLDIPAFDWEPGQCWFVCGQAGSGKTLFTELVAGVRRPTEGRRSYPAWVARSPDARLGIAPPHHVALFSHRSQQRVKADFASFHQARWHGQWSEPCTVRQLLGAERVLGIRPFEVGAKQRIPPDWAERVAGECAAFGVLHLLQRRVAELSNGELRRVLLARTWLAEPRLIVLDDPLGGLDPRARTIVADVLAERWRRGAPLMVSAAVSEPFTGLATDILHLDGGRRRQATASGRGPEPPAVPSTGERRAAPRAHASGTGPLEPRGDRAASRFSPATLEPATPCRSPLLECRGVTVRAPGATLLSGLDWCVTPGQHWVITGPNGAGKSTLMAVIAGDHPQAYANDVRIAGQRLGRGLSLWQLRGLVGLVSAELVHHYPRGEALLDVVLSGFGGTLGLYRRSTSQQTADARRALEELSLGALAHRALGEASESEQRLALVARALVAKPRLLILDEPTQGLAARARDRVHEAVDHLAARTAPPASSAQTVARGAADGASSGRTVLLVTHHAESLPACITHHLGLDQGVAVHRGRLPCPR